MALYGLFMLYAILLCVTIDRLPTKTYTVYMQIKDTSLLKKLEKSGLTDKEALVYLALLELGGAYPSRIAEYTSINRTTVYNILLNLNVRGLVNEIEKKNKLFYQVENPQRLIKYSESKVRMAEDSLETLKNILPGIESLYGSSEERPKITYYEKEEGLLQIYEDHISTNKPYEMLAWANAEALRDFLPTPFFDRYVKTKERIGIKTRGILPDTAENRGFNDIRYKGIEKKAHPDLRYVSSDHFPVDGLGEITIYGENKVSIVNFEKTKMVGTIIEDASIQKIMKMIFELSWESRLLKE